MFYSALSRFVQGSTQARAPAAQWKAVLSKAPGIKAEELEWTGVLDWLDTQEGSITREALAGYLSANGVQVQEVVKGGRGGPDRLSPAQVARQRFELEWAERQDAWENWLYESALEKAESEYSLLSEEDQENYDDAEDYMNRKPGAGRAPVWNMFTDDELEVAKEEAWLSVRHDYEYEEQARREEDDADGAVNDAENNDTKWSSYTLPGGENYTELLITLPDGKGYKSGHWSEPNVLAHMRFKERVGPNGERVLALEEIQSDWHQEGRKRGYIDEQAKANLAAALAAAKATRKATFAAMEAAARAGRRFLAETGRIDFSSSQGSTYEDITHLLLTGYLDSPDAAQAVALRQNLIDARNEDLAAWDALDRLSRKTVQGVPGAPFKNNAWVTLALKRMVRYAADNGFDAVAWIPGNVQNGQVVELDDDRGDFYDKIVPLAGQKLVKKYGAALSRVPLEGAGYKVTLANGKIIAHNQTKTGAATIANNFPGASVQAEHEFHYLPLTAALREAALTEGFPLFQPGDPPDWGPVTPPDDVGPMVLDMAYVREAYAPELVNGLPAAIRNAQPGQTAEQMFRIARTVLADLTRRSTRPEVQAIRQRAVQWRDWFADIGIEVGADEATLRSQIEAYLRERPEAVVRPDQAAEVFGFQSGEEMLVALGRLSNRSKLIRDEVTRRMGERYGDTYSTGRIAEVAREMAETELASRTAEIELEALSTAVGQKAARTYARDMAVERLGVMTVKEIAGFARYEAAATRFGDAALKAVRDGDPQKAIEFKQRQMAALEMVSVMRKETQRLERLRNDLLGYIDLPGRRAKISKDYLNRIDAVLAEYELRVSRQSGAPRRRAETAAKYVAEMTEQGRLDEVAEHVILLAERGETATWNSLNLFDVENLEGTIKHLAHLGRTKNRLLVARDKREFDAVVSELVTTLNETADAEARQVGSPVDSREVSFTPTPLETFVRQARRAMASLRRVEFLLQAKDRQALGPLWRTLWQPFAEAADISSAMNREAAAAIKALWSSYSMAERDKLFNQRLSTPELRVPGAAGLTKADVLSMALNWGNAYNREALLEGYGWASAGVEAVFNRVLTDKDWDFVEGVWALLDSYKEPSFQLDRDTKGVEPKPVKPLAFTLPSGRVIAGGYYPVEYDAGKARPDSIRQARQEQAQALKDMGKTFSRPMTDRGRLIARKGSGGKPVKLALSVIDQAVAETIHDIAYRRAVIDANRVIGDARFTTAFIRAAGVENYRALPVWVQAIAREKADQASTPFSEGLMGVRKNFSVAVMGWKVGTALMQATGVVAGMSVLGPRYAAQGVAKALAHRVPLWGAWQWVAQKSEFMRDRPQGFDRDVRAVMADQRAATGPIKASMRTLQQSGFLMMGVMDAAVSTAVWIGAYDKALDGNVDGVAAGNERDAVLYADGVVRQTQTAGRTQDLPRLMVDGEVGKLLTVLYGYFSGLLNLTMNQVQATRRGDMSALAFIGSMTLLYVVVPVLAELSAGRGPDEEDDETWEQWLGTAVVSNVAGLVPVGRDVANFILRPEFGYQLTPVGGAIETIARGGRVLAEAGGGEPMTEADLRAAFMGAGFLFGLPAAQLWITGEYAYDVWTGAEDPTEDPADALREAFVRNER